MKGVTRTTRIERYVKVELASHAFKRMLHLPTDYRIVHISNEEFDQNGQPSVTVECLKMTKQELAEERFRQRESHHEDEDDGTGRRKLGKQSKKKRSNHGR